MALSSGTVTADTGMGKLIFDRLDTLLSPPLQAAVDAADGPAKDGAQQALDQAREGWRKLAFAVAAGVIEHLIANLEIVGITTQGNVSVGVQGNTGPAAPANHLHSISLTGSATNVVFAQNNGGTGHVQ